MLNINKHTTQHRAVMIIFPFSYRRNLGGYGPPLFGLGGLTAHFISTPSQKFCLGPHFSDQSYATAFNLSTIIIAQMPSIGGEKFVVLYIVLDCWTWFGNPEPTTLYSGRVSGSVAWTWLYLWSIPTSTDRKTILVSSALKLHKPVDGVLTLLGRISTTPAGQWP